MFLNHLYGGMDEPELKIIDVFICKCARSSPTLRAQLIETVWGGYVLARAARVEERFPPDQSLQRARQLSPPTGTRRKRRFLFRESRGVAYKTSLAKKLAPRPVEFYHGTVPSNGTAKSVMSTTRA